MVLYINYDLKSQRFPLLLLVIGHPIRDLPKDYKWLLCEDCNMIETIDNKSLMYNRLVLK